MINRGGGISSSVEAYLKGQGANSSTAIHDDSQNHSTVSIDNDADISTTQAYFGGSSLHFPAPLDTIRMPITAIGTGDCSVAFWGYLDSVSSAYAFLFGFEVSEGLNLGVIGYIAASKYFTWRGNGVAGGCEITADTSQDLDEWFYLHVNRVSGTTTMYLNGSQVAQYGSTDTSDYDSTEITIGQLSQWYTANFYIDDFILTKGFALAGSYVPTRQRG